MNNFATKSSHTFPRRDNRRFLQNVAAQLDYYMSAQFVGVACALTNNLYETNGIKLEFLVATCAVGHELHTVKACGAPITRARAGFFRCSFIAFT